MARLQEERDAANENLTSITAERDDLYNRTSIFERQLRDNVEQRTITLCQQEEEMAQQRRQMEEMEATLHQREQDNYGRMMVIIGCIGGAFVVMIGISFFLCNSSKKKKIEKMTRKMNAEFVAERRREKERSEAMLKILCPKDDRPQPRHVHAAFHEEFGMKEVFPVTPGEGKGLVQLVKEMGIKSIIVTPGATPEGEAEGQTTDTTTTDETPGEDGEDAKGQVEASFDTI